MQQFGTKSQSKNPNFGVKGDSEMEEENRFKHARTKIKKESVVTVAKNTKLARSLIDELETNAGKPRGVAYQKVVTLARYYKVPLDWLIGDRPLDNPSNDKKVSIATEVTGLSNEAIEKLESIKSYRFSPVKILSEMICNPSFPLLMQRISELKELTPLNSEKALSQNILYHLISELDGKADPTPNYQTEQDIVDIKEFQVSKVFMAILRDLERGVNDGGNS